MTSSAKSTSFNYSSYSIEAYTHRLPLPPHTHPLVKHLKRSEILDHGLAYKQAYKRHLSITT